MFKKSCIQETLIPQCVQIIAPIQWYPPFWHWLALFWYSFALLDNVQCSAVQCSAVQCSAKQCSAVQFNAVQCSAVQWLFGPNFAYFLVCFHDSWKKMVVITYLYFSYSINCYYVAVLYSLIWKLYCLSHSPLNVDDSVLWILYMFKQLLSSSLIEVIKPGCPGNVKSGETSWSWLNPQSIGSQCKI